MARHRFERLGRALLIGSWCLSAVAAWSDSTSESTTAALLSGADIIHGTDFAQSGGLRHGFALSSVAHLEYPGARADRRRVGRAVVQRR